MKKNHKILKFPNGSMIEFKGKQEGDRMYSCGDLFLTFAADPYTRERAIKHGILHDVTKEAKTLGFTCPVAVSDQVWALINDIPSYREKHESVFSRTLDILTILRICAQGPAKKTFLLYVLLITHCKNSHINIKAVFEKGDNFETVITISLPK